MGHSNISLTATSRSRGTLKYHFASYFLYTTLYFLPFTPRFSPSALISTSQVSQLFSFHNAPFFTFSSQLFIITSSTISCTYHPQHIISTSQVSQLFSFHNAPFSTFSSQLFIITSSTISCTYHPQHYSFFLFGLFCNIPPHQH